MFLANLTDDQKNAFLGLAQTLVSVDGVVSDDETSMLEQYKQEMSLSTSTSIPQQEIEQSIEVFKTAFPSIKKQIVFELVALACADNDYADTEHRLLNEIGISLDLDAAFLGECKAYVRELTALYERIGKLVSE